MTTSSRLTALLRDDPIVVTGRGVVAATGLGVENLWDAVASRRSPARWLDLPRACGGTRRVAAFPVAAPDWAGHPWGRMARRLDLGGQYGMAAAFQAVREADFAGSPPVPERLGVIMGSSRGPKGKWLEGQDLLVAGRRMKPTLAATTTLASAVGGICQVLPALGPGWLVSTACASGAYAIAQAAEQILLGHADVMVAGGTDDTFQELIHAGLEAAGVLASGGGAADLCRPFAPDRNGLVPGSGAGVLVLESLSSARRRGVKPLAILSGWSLGADPEGLAGMDAEGRGLQRCLRAALEMAGVGPEEIGYLNAHGTGTVANDAAEAAAVRAVFGEGAGVDFGAGPRAGGLAVSSSKSITGHCLGATPAMEVLLCIEALRRGELPPAFPGMDGLAGGVKDGCGLMLSAGGVVRGLRHVMSTSAAFWGYQAALLFSRVGE